MHKLAIKICLILAILSQAVYGTTYLEEIPASDVLTKIYKSEPIVYDHVIIKGDLDVNNLTTLGEDGVRIIRSPIIIRNSMIDGNVSAQQFTFDNYVNFRGSQIKGTSDFSDSQFNKITDFTETQFNRKAGFNIVLNITYLTYHVRIWESTILQRKDSPLGQESYLSQFQ